MAATAVKMDQPAMPEFALDDRRPSVRDSRKLESWKEIARHLNRSERTVRRWEQSERLPVYRHQHESRGSVYAFTDELDEWLRTRTQSAPLRQESETGPSAPASPRRTWKLVLAGVVILATAATGVYLLNSQRQPATQTLRASPLTALPGEESSPSFSPDGRFVAFAWKKPDGSQDIWIKDTRTDTNFAS